MKKSITFDSMNMGMYYVTLQGQQLLMGEDGKAIQASQRQGHHHQFPILVNEKFKAGVFHEQESMWTLVYTWTDNTVELAQEIITFYIENNIEIVSANFSKTNGLIIQIKS